VALGLLARGHGLRLFGTYAMNSLRMEKAYRAWGSELTSEVDMLEASMERFLRLDKEDFLGKAATQARQRTGPRLKLVYLEVANTDCDCLGNEPVHAGGALVGLTTSGAFGHATGRSLAFAYVRPEFAAAGRQLEIAVLGEKRKALILAEAAWDPANLRPRA
jgi:dimethylglycine dehydrogenase